MSSEPCEGVFEAKVDWVYEKVGGEEEEVGAAEAGEQVVEDVCHGPGDHAGDDAGDR